MLSPPAAPQVTCERCGAFVTKVSKLGAQRLCAGCIGRIATTKRFWPGGYIKGIGSLMHPSIAATLLALNCARLGHSRAARKYATHAALWAVFSVVALTPRLGALRTFIL